MHDRPPDMTTEQALLRSYCAEAEHRLQSAASRTEALGIRDELCARFKAECNSTIVRTATERYINDLIAKTWDGAAHGTD